MPLTLPLFLLYMKNKSSFFKKIYVLCPLAILCCLLWGSAFPVIKIGYKTLDINSADTASIILFAGCRFFLAGVFTVLIFSLIEKKFLLPKKSSYGKICVLSLFQTVIQYLFFYLGLAHTTGVRASVIDGLNVFFVLLISAFIFKQERFTVKKLVGCTFGFIGVAVAGGLFGGEFGSSINSGDLMLVFSALGYSFSSVFMKEFAKDDNPALLSGYQFILGGAVMSVVGFFMGGRISFNAGGILILLYLACVSAVAYSLWSILLKYNEVSSITVFSSFTPIFGFVLSYLLLGEENGNLLFNIIGLLLVVVGMSVLNVKRKAIGKS